MIYNNSAHEFMTCGLFILSVKVIIINNYYIIIIALMKKKYLYSIFIIVKINK